LPIANTGRVNGWAVSLHGHAPEQQVARWGLPLLTHLYLSGTDLREQFNRTRPSDDNSLLTSSIASTIRLRGITDDRLERRSRVEN
jgi:hypothetical protein